MAPLREAPWRRMELLPLDERLANDAAFQAPWYRLVATMAAGKRVLDVGAGTGYGAVLLRAGGVAEVLGIDPLPAGAGVVSTPLADIPSGSWDWAVAMDVIEHVQEDLPFLRDLMRVARERVFFSTPNWTRSRCANEFHVREYTPAELRALLSAAAPGAPWQAWIGDDDWTLTPLGAELHDDEARANFGVLLEVTR